MSFPPPLYLSLRSKLLLVGLVLLCIPWIALQSLQITRAFLLDGQAQAQLLLSEGIASLLTERAALLKNPGAANDNADLPVYRADGRIRIDGYNDDWPSLRRLGNYYGHPQSGFSLVTAEQGSQLYVLIDVYDNQLIARNPGNSQLDQHDQMRLRFVDQHGQSNFLLIPYEGTGVVNALSTDASWLRLKSRFGDFRITAYSRQTAQGYRLELALPLAELGEVPALSLHMLDVSSKSQPTLSSTTSNPHYDIDNLLVFRLPALEQTLHQLNLQAQRVWLIDSQLRVRATGGDLNQNDRGTQNNAAPSLTPGDLFAHLLLNTSPAQTLPTQTTVTREDQWLTEVLAGESAVQQRDGLLLTAHPIRDAHGVVGIVLVEQSINHLLMLQRASLTRIVNLTLLAFLAVAAVVLLFTARLTRRIRLLDTATRQARDNAGRLQDDLLIDTRRGGDELDDLARNIALMLTQIREHQQFLHNIPRTLRHEINNPLNTISTSLQSLSDESKLRDAKPLESAQRGLQKIGLMVQKLADAASLEAALAIEDMEAVNIAALLRSYLDNREKRIGSPCFALTASERPLWIEGCDLYLEQMLDKIIDNALDFRNQDSLIQVALGVVQNRVVLTISNRGPTLNEARLTEIFQLMSSQRTNSQSNDGHFGLGLYVAKTIAEHHRGAIRAGNLEDGSGVRFTLSFPLLPVTPP